MGKIEVTQADIDCAEQVHACHSHIFAAGIIARYRLSHTPQSVEPVATTSEMPGSNGGFTMAAFKASDVPVGTPLYAHPPATDVAAQDDSALLERLADEACQRLGIDPNEVVDPVGPVLKKTDIIYAMYTFAREKFGDTEPNDVAALVEAAKAILHAVCHETGFAAAVRADSGLAYPWEPLDIAESQLRQALVPFTEGQP